MLRLKNLLGGAWSEGQGEGVTLINPATEAVLGTTSSAGLDLVAGLAFARREGGAALRSLSYAGRGKLLAAMAGRIHEHRDELIELAMTNGGNTRSDAKFDIDGAMGTLAHYAELGAALGEVSMLADGESVQLGRAPRLAGRHVHVPRRGVALLINAFNFPAWGFGEKAASALLAGMPVVCKPAPSSAAIAHRLVEVLADVLPAGAVSIVADLEHELPALLGYGDVLSFTGSSRTAARLRALPNVLDASVRLGVEADSLNSAILGADVEAGSETYELFLGDVVREIRQKAGQKCTAIRRIFVPPALRERVREDLVERLARVVVGEPFADGVQMGPLATAQQRASVLEGACRLAEHADVVLGRDGVRPVGVPEGKGYFVPVTLLEARDPGAALLHRLEVFGPVATLFEAPDDVDALVELVARGEGGLVCSTYTDDRKLAGALVHGLAPHHGRLVLGSQKIAGQAMGPGAVLPQLLHGGPGRAGGGEELGGLRGLSLYSQRTALQGDRALLDGLLKG
ncbi:MAG: 3,4-dehydroadipyl-CoA semialdehyde dehydrogenase [Deltaproteobacteria bacterium]|nr:3,4-dehydroadipyl-CoA semialdehyde dehydrogenase [Deltaproteobacteria bacterium]